MEFIVGLLFLVVIFLVCLIPTWLVMLAYNYIVALVGHPNWEIPVTLLSVICVAFILTVIRGIFRGRK
jgi:hypothetical protein